MTWPSGDERVRDAPRRDRRPAAGSRRAARRAAAVPAAARWARRPSSGGCAGTCRDEMRPWIHDHMTRAVRADDWEAYTGLSRVRRTRTCPRTCSATGPTSSPTSTSVWRGSELSRTITAHIAKDGYWYIHPEQHRTLSIREAATTADVPRLVPVRRSAQPPVRADRERGPAAGAEAVGRALLDSMRGRSARACRLRRCARERLLEWGAAQPEHPWRRPGVDPWLVLAGELGLERAGRRDDARQVRVAPTIAPDARRRCSRSRTAPALASGRRQRPRRRDCWSLPPRRSSSCSTARCPADDLELRAHPGVGDSRGEDGAVLRSRSVGGPAAHRRGPGRDACGRERAPPTLAAAARSAPARRAGGAGRARSMPPSCDSATPSASRPSRDVRECPLRTDCATGGAARRPPTDREAGRRMTATR